MMTTTKKREERTAAVRGAFVARLQRLCMLARQGVDHGNFLPGPYIHNRLDSSAL